VTDQPRAEFRFDTINEAARRLAEIVADYELLTWLDHDYFAEIDPVVNENLSVALVEARIAVEQILIEVPSPVPSPQADAAEGK